MAAFHLPHNVLLDSHPITMGSLPEQVFSLCIDESTVEDIIKSAESGEDIFLNTGPAPTLSYGSGGLPLTPPPDEYVCDLFTTAPEKSLRKAAKFPNPTMPIKGYFFDRFKTTKQPKQPKRAAAHQAVRRSATSPSHIPLPAGTVAPRSLPASPGFTSSGSPSSSASQQAHLRAKERRFVLVHELAIRDQTEEHLRKKWKGSRSDLQAALEKSADLDTASKTWSLRNHWKELDVFNYPYKTEEDRQQAIDNAVKQYDRIRLAVSDPEWQRLLPIEERGRGKCLSKIQANIISRPVARPPAPVVKFKQQTKKTEHHEAEAKGKKAGARSAKAAAKAAERQKARQLSEAVVFDSDDDTGTEDETYIAKPSSSDAAPNHSVSPTVKGVAMRVPRKRAAKKTGEAAKAGATAPRVLKRKPAALRRAPKKRMREEEDSSSSSAAPMMKKRMTKECASNVIRAPINKASVAVAAKRPPLSSDADVQTTKNISSAPADAVGRADSAVSGRSTLSRSPPLDASEPEDGETPPPPPQRRGHDKPSLAAGRKRPGEDGQLFQRKKQSRVSPSVMETAHKFRSFYAKYETLHFELINLENPPQDKVAALVAMRDRLAGWKKEIFEGVPAR